MKVRDLLTDETKWVKGVLACRADGRACSDVFGPDVTRWCLVGAVERCYPDVVAHVAVTDRIRDRLDVLSVSGWNDAEARTFAEVRALVEELDI